MDKVYCYSWEAQSGKVKTGSIGGHTYAVDSKLGGTGSTGAVEGTALDCGSLWKAQFKRQAKWKEKYGI